jgi:hypothetical protein
MENIFNNIVDISKTTSHISNKPNLFENITNIVNVTPKIEENLTSGTENHDTEINNSFSSKGNDNVSQNILNINSLLSKNIQNQSDISSNSNYFIQGDINNLLSHINDLNEKIIYYNTLANIKDKENQKLIEENKILRTNLEIIKRRFNLK